MIENVGNLNAGNLRENCFRLFALLGRPLVSVQKILRKLLFQQRKTFVFFFFYFSIGVLYFMLLWKFIHFLEQIFTFQDNRAYLHLQFAVNFYLDNIIWYRRRIMHTLNISGR